MELKEARDILNSKKSGISVFSANKEQLDNDVALTIGSNCINRLIKEKSIQSIDEDDDSFEIKEIFSCPQCGEIIKNSYIKLPFCLNPKCGQALKWD